MKTAIQLLLDGIKEIRAQGEDFLLNHAQISRWNYPSSSGDVIMIGTGDYSYDQLDESGLKAQARLKESGRRYLSLVGLLLKYHKGEAESTSIRSVEYKLEEVTRENQTTYSKNVNESYQDLSQQLGDLEEEISKIYGVESEETLVVPDTNALYHNTDIGNWRFSEFERYTILLVPAVLRELDNHKMSHKVESVREKAKKLVRMIKEFGRRGDIGSGVNLRKGVSKMRAIAIEPDMSNTLEWLQSDVADDRIIAMALELMWRHPRSSVVIVTADINVQNKARFASLPFLEPPLSGA